MRAFPHKSPIVHAVAVLKRWTLKFCTRVLYRPDLRFSYFVSPNTFIWFDEVPNSHKHAINWRKKHEKEKTLRQIFVRTHGVRTHGRRARFHGLTRKNDVNFGRGRFFPSFNLNQPLHRSCVTSHDGRIGYRVPNYSWFQSWYYLQYQVFCFGLLLLIVYQDRKDSARITLETAW